MVIRSGETVSLLGDPSALFLLAASVALAISVSVLAASVVAHYREEQRNSRRLALFKQRMIAAFRSPGLFGYEDGICLLCGVRVERDQDQAQVRVEGSTLRILSASNPSVAEIFLPPSEDTRIAHLGCVSYNMTTRIEGMSQMERLFTKMTKDGPSRYIVFHDFDTEKYYWGYFPLNWRPCDQDSIVPFNMVQPEILVEFLLATARQNI